MIPPVWRCNRRVGFLFPHACERTTPVDCPDCRNGQIQDPYRTRYDRFGYSDDDFDVYDGDGSDGAGASIAFTEADGESLVQPDDGFENDLSAS